MRPATRRPWSPSPTSAPRSRRSHGDGGYLTGIDPALITKGYSFDWVEGSDATLAELGRNGLILSESVAEDQNLSVGQTVMIRTAESTSLQAEVKGIYKPPPFYPLLGDASISIAAFDELVERPRNQYTFVNVAGRPERGEPRRARGGHRRLPGRARADAPGVGRQGGR